ncbi:prolipoprotein diacylglyceryl transferase [Desulfurobacterium sp.]
MHPILFKIGPFTVYTFGVMVAIGIICGYFILIKLGEKEGINTNDLSDLMVWTVISGFIGARIFFFLYNPQYLHPIWRIFYFWEGGLVWYGGFLFGFITALYLAKKKNIPIWKTADIAVIAGEVGLGFGRIGCTMAGCCYGKVCHSRFALVFRDPHSAAPLNVPLYPTEPVSSAANFLIAGILYLLYKRRKAPGEIFGFYFIFYGIFRFLIEFWRATPKTYFGTLSNNQIMSIFMVILGIALVIYRRKAFKEV